ncbi:Os12g0434801 [Oryza sativa Japonica Group]|uniref:Os12g0434801 protein n=1 Tax=Oryza sativa subsp. japonica TaxID=39947 RepID=A0A0N7KTZ1_ORYSJ|nr:Os12g0434801 [Oryza sativa Japonica Group]
MEYQKIREKLAYLWLGVWDMVLVLLGGEEEWAAAAVASGRSLRCRSCHLRARLPPPSPAQPPPPPSLGTAVAAAAVSGHSRSRRLWAQPSAAAAVACSG